MSGQINLQNLPKSKLKQAARFGRGIGSGTGKTSTHGHKGAGARSGTHIKGFEGGQTPLYMRLPHRGFNSLTRGNTVSITTDYIANVLEKHAFSGSTVTKNDLVALGICKKADLKRNIKLIMGAKKVALKVKVEADKASKTATAFLAAIEPVEKKTEQSKADSNHTTKNIKKDTEDHK